MIGPGVEGLGVQALVLGSSMAMLLTLYVSIVSCCPLLTSLAFSGRLRTATQMFVFVLVC